VTLARRFVRSGAWTTGAHAAVTLVLAIRSIALARLVPVEVFGVYAFAAALTTLTAVLARFGMDDALVQRAPETDNAISAAGVHFTLAAALAGLWFLLVLGLAWLNADGQTLVAIAVLALAQLALLLSATSTALLRRAVQHRLLSQINLIATLLASILGLGLAWLGYGLWALLAIDAVAALCTLAALFLWGPAWRPRLAWNTHVARHLLRFGSRNALGRLLENAQMKVDKLWAGGALGAQALGFYSRAFAYSRAPVGLVDRPLASIVLGAYAELAHDRGRLSAAVNRINELVVHGAALATVTVGLVAPELIVMLIGAKWLPMLDAFRLLLLAAVPTTLVRSLVQLLVGAGDPASRIRIATVRLLVLGVGIGILGERLGIVGVALAVLGSAGAGLALSLHQAARYADLDVRAVLLVPTIATAAALLAGLLAGGALLPPGAGPWTRLLLQAGASCAGYAFVLATMRGRAFLDHGRFILRQLGPARGADP
jgi:O-antigen/teichoic acid export membrane protein